MSPMSPMSPLRQDGTKWDIAKLISRVSGKVKFLIANVMLVTF